MSASHGHVGDSKRSFWLQRQCCTSTTRGLQLQPYGMQDCKFELYLFGYEAAAMLSTAFVFGPAAKGVLGSELVFCSRWIFVCTLSCCGVNGRFGRAGVLDMRACERCSERNVQLPSPRCGLITVCGHFTPQFVQVYSTPRTSAQSNLFQLFAFVFSCHPSWVLKLIIVSIFFAFLVPYFYLCQFRQFLSKHVVFNSRRGFSIIFFQPLATVLNSHIFSEHF